MYWYTVIVRCVEMRVAVPHEITDPAERDAVEGKIREACELFATRTDLCLQRGTVKDPAEVIISG